LDSQFVAKALQLPSPERNIVFSGVTTDSRQIKKDCLFVAIPGDTFDGHDFIPQAIEKGAAGILCREGFSAPGSAQFFSSGSTDSIDGYRRLAGLWRRAFDIPVIAVVGSVGKTTTKELLAAALRGKFKSVLKTEGSNNGFVGIPMTLLTLNSAHEIAVIEVGIDEPGAMAQHMALLAPTAVVLSAIGPEHLEKLRDLRTVAFEENLALRFTSDQGGKVALNWDDPWVSPLISELKTPHVLSFTLSDSDPSISGAFVRGSLKSELEIKTSGSDSISLTPPLPGDHNARNAAFAVGLQHGLTLAELKEGLKTFQGAKGRSEVKHLASGTAVLCDYYNANPTSTEAAIQVLQNLAAHRERWVCLGDMLELGEKELDFHRALATPLIEGKVEHVLLYGKRMKSLQDELTRRGFSGELAHFDSHSEMARTLRARALSGVILIKGSHSMKMEKVFEELNS
jgi:UDP-N-acetylmuramoyl-tripeptide--D-alanyl-D-alanine ligase